MKKIKLLAAFFIAFSSQAQNDLSVQLVEYSEGEIVTSTTESDPFQSQILITNEGVDPVEIGEFFQMAYLIDGVVHSLLLTPGFTSTGTIDGAPFLPGESFLLGGVPIVLDAEVGGGEIEICAMVFPVLAAILDFDFSDDINPADNSYCVTAVIADVTGVEEEELNYEIISANNQLIINCTGQPENDNSHVFIFGMNGRQVYSDDLQLTMGSTNTLDLSFLSSGIYSIVVEQDGVLNKKKIYIQ